MSKDKKSKLWIIFHLEYMNREQRIETWNRIKRKIQLDAAAMSQMR